MRQQNSVEKNPEKASTLKFRKAFHNYDHFHVLHTVRYILLFICSLKIL